MIEKGLEMYFIFVSSKGADLAPISGIGKDSISWCMPSGYEIKSEYHRKISKGRILDLYGFHDDLDKCCSGQDRVGFFHGYLLGDEHPTIMNMDPAKSYYGVYSHGMVSKEDCYFATDEIGLSPLHYSNDEEVLMVSNNPHLIAIYKRMLGIKMRVESTLAVWHAVGITSRTLRDIRAYSELNLGVTFELTWMGAFFSQRRRGSERVSHTRIFATRASRSFARA